MVNSRNRECVLRATEEASPHLSTVLPQLAANEEYVVFEAHVDGLDSVALVGYTPGTSLELFEGLELKNAGEHAV